MLSNLAALVRREAAKRGEIDPEERASLATGPTFVVEHSHNILWVAPLHTTHHHLLHPFSHHIPHSMSTQSTYDKFENHKSNPPVSSDSHSPCPALNTLANHGYMSVIYYN